MEIKQGDKVRVSGHYIAMMITDGIVNNALNNATFVVDNIDREGRMAHVSCKLPISLQSPIAHLVKVNAEAKEPKHIFYGDYAKVASKSLNELKRKAHPEWYSSTEPTEQTEAEEEPCTGHINFAERIKRQQEAHQAIVDEFRDKPFDWDTYTANLAKEIALKVANKQMNNPPEDIGAYAVQVAKAVVEGLKGK